MTKSLFIGHSKRATKLLGIIHNDICEPLTVKAKNRYSFFVLFTDDLNGYGYGFLMKHKSKCFEKFMEFKSKVEKQIGNGIKIL